MRIVFRTKKIEKLCTDKEKAKRELPSLVAERLIALIHLIECSINLSDLSMNKSLNLHPLKGDRLGQYAMDIAGRKQGYRLIVKPLSNDDGVLKQVIDYETVEVVLIWEVSKHYE